MHDIRKPENSHLFECLRFGSSIPGGYWGCCAGDIMQCFKSDPDELASIQFVNGDGGEPQMRGSEFLFAGPTNKDVFLARLRQGTFGGGDMPNHFFIAVLTEDQLCEGYGRKWLAILKEHGFEFIRTVANSVYTGQDAMKEPWKGDSESLNYVFGLFRGIGCYAPEDAFTPPEEWTSLPSVKREAWECVGEKSERKQLTHDHAVADIAIWNRVGEVKLLTEAELREKGAPVILAAKRTDCPQEVKETREAREGTKKKETSLRAAPETGSTPAPPMNVAF